MCEVGWGQLNEARQDSGFEEGRYGVLFVGEKKASEQQKAYTQALQNCKNTFSSIRETVLTFNNVCQGNLFLILNNI